jgi:hypothetical protein
MQVEIMEIDGDTPLRFKEWFFGTQRRLWSAGVEGVVLGKYDQHSATAHLCLLRTTISGNYYIIEWEGVDSHSDGIAEYAKRIFYDAVEMLQAEESPELAATIDWMLAEYKELSLELKIQEIADEIG